MQPISPHKNVMSLSTKLSFNSLVGKSSKARKDQPSTPTSSFSSINSSNSNFSSMQTSSSSLNQLSQIETAVLMKHMSLILVHLRARIRFEIGLSGQVFSRVLANSSFVDDARVVASMGAEEELLYALQQLPLETLAGVVKLAFHSHNDPMLEAHVCGQIFKLFETNSNNDEIEVDDLRDVLVGLPGTKIDLLGQLMAILATDGEVSKMAYGFGPAVFLPRYGAGQKTEQVEKYNRNGFNAVTWPQMAVRVTRYMIENCDEIFGLDDEDTIERLALKLQDRKAMQSLSSNTSKVAGVENDSVVELPATPAPLALCKVNFSFKAKNAWELSVSRGDSLEVLERGKDAWWEVRTLDGRVGLVPETFVNGGGDDQDIEKEIEATVREMNKLLRVKERKLRRKQQQRTSRKAHQQENAAPPANNTLVVATAAAGKPQLTAIRNVFEAVD